MAGVAGVGTPSALVERGKRVALTEILREQRHGEVELTASRGPDEPLLDEPFAMDRDAALILRPVSDGNVGRAVRRSAPLITGASAWFHSSAPYSWMK